MSSNVGTSVITWNVSNPTLFTWLTDVENEKETSKLFAQRVGSRLSEKITRSKLLIAIQKWEICEQQGQTFMGKCMIQTLL